MLTLLRSRLSPLIVAFLATSAQAVPSPSRSQLDHSSKIDVAPRAAISSFCQEETASTSSFILYNNPWGEGYATSGSQCTHLDASGEGWIAWQSSWTWAGGDYDVKGYPNAVLNVDPIQLSMIGSLSSQWNWTYTGLNLKGDVSYDAFLSAVNSKSQADQKIEVMIWLATYGGTAPIGEQIATVTIGGLPWNLYKGPNRYWTVYSFVAPRTINYYSGDLNEFFTYLTTQYSEDVPSSYYLQTLGAGTEPVTGSDAWFTVSPYTLTLDMKY